MFVYQDYCDSHIHHITLHFLLISESKWEPPEDGYVSLEDQEKKQNNIKMKEELKRRKKEERSKQKKDENNTSEKKESSKKRRKKEKDNEMSIVTAGPAPKPDPYGAWTTVTPK